MIAWRCFWIVLVLALLELPGQALSSIDTPVLRVARVNSLELLTDPANSKDNASLDFELGLSDETRIIRIELSLNQDVVSRSASVQHLLRDGSVQALQQSTQTPALAYKGAAWLKREHEAGWSRAGWARFSYRNHQGRLVLQGAFKVNADTYHLASDSTYRKTTGRSATDPAVPLEPEPYMVVWRDSDRAVGAGHPDVLARAPEQQNLCGTGYESLDTRTISPRQFGQPQPPFDPLDFIGSTQGCPSSRRAALIGIATDCTYTSEFSSIQEARDNIVSEINTASQIYEDTFNISLVIQNLTLSDASCPDDAPASTPWNVPCTRGFNINDRLSTFSQWSGQFDDGNAIWTLLSACNTGQTVGIAWLGSVCSRGSQSQNRGGRTQNVASTNVVVRTQNEWQVIAHEIGHNFGASHDCTSRECGSSSASQDCCPLSRSSCDANGRYMMNPVTSDNIDGFSDCSIGTICTSIGRQVVDTSCFVSPEDAPDINESECGNGIVEGSEECDCGGLEGCPENSCCDPDTCRFRDGAECDPTNDLCCNDSCQIASSGFVCRNSTGTCDPEETCNGSSAQCPEDTFEPNGESCGDGLACASGHCTSRDLQCSNAFNETEGTVESCNDNSCQMFCNVPGQGCSQASQIFLDGTSCGGGRMCFTGSCERPGSRNGPNGNNPSGGGGNWFDNNRTLVIGVASGLGGLIVLIIVGCMISRFRHKKGAKRLSKRWPGESPVAQYVHGHRPPQGPGNRVMYG